jgi:hypothetical protein
MLCKLTLPPSAFSGVFTGSNRSTWEAHMEISTTVIQVNEYELDAPARTYVDAIGALARRTETEGHPGVLTYQFYVNADAATAGATIVYEDAAAWLAHHRLAYQWEEMAALQATVSLQRLTLFGPFNEEVEEWIAGAGISYVHYGTWAAGFVRPAAE